MENNKIVKDTDIDSLFNSISDLIEHGRKRIEIEINNQMTLIYWNIGKFIKIEILKDEKPEYGEKVIDKISYKLSEKHGKGYSRPNLFRMIKFHELFDETIVSALSRQLY
jgi:hypothetical protein